MTASRNIKLVLEYFGVPFAGWQVQPGLRTVQGELQAAIERVTGQRVTVYGAGRTDAGVHALGQVANFRVTHRLEPVRYRDALNYHLPDEIHVRSAEEAPPQFHARYDAVWRRYRYLVATARSALYRHYRWENPVELSLDRLKQAAALVVGEHDFSAFCVAASRKEHNVCRVDHSCWRQVGPLLVYEIRGNRFLHSMVRSLVGGMVNLAVQHPDRHPANLTLESFEDMLARPSGRRNPFTAPPHGLYLVAVGYGQGKEFS